MPWTKITRAQYLRNGLRYASDMTDAEWRLIARKLPPRRRLGRPRKVDLRKVVEAVLFILSTGCQWRALPREFPPYSTVQGYFYTWRDTRRWHRIVRALVRQARRKLDRKPTPTAAVIDSQSAPTTQAGGPRGFDPGKRVHGASGTSLPIPMGSCWPFTSIPPTFRMSMVQSPCLNTCETAFPGCDMSLLIAFIAESSSLTRSLIAGRGPLRSSSVRRGSKASSFCHGAGSSSEPSPGSADADASPRTSKVRPQLKSPGSSSPISGS